MFKWLKDFCKNCYHKTNGGTDDLKVTCIETILPPMITMSDCCAWATKSEKTDFYIPEIDYYRRRYFCLKCGNECKLKGYILDDVPEENINAWFVIHANKE